jgi:hypothetical protein
MGSSPRLGVSYDFAAGAEVLSRALSLFERVEALPARAAGALRFGAEGFLLVESRSVCFAAAAGMRQRFTTLLRDFHDPPLERAYLEEIYRRCKDHQSALVDALLSTGRVSKEGLRAALFQHTVEAIAHIALSGAGYEGFIPYARNEARFVFSTAELLERLGAQRDPAGAAAARTELEAVLVPDTTGWAFVREAGTGTPMIVALGGASPPPSSEIVDMFDDDVRLAAASFHGAHVVAWRTNVACFVARCENRAGMARLVAVLDRRISSEH